MTTCYDTINIRFDHVAQYALHLPQRFAILCSYQVEYSSKLISRMKELGLWICGLEIQAQLFFYVRTSQT